MLHEDSDHDPDEIQEDIEAFYYGCKDDSAVCCQPIPDESKQIILVYYEYCIHVSFQFQNSSVQKKKKLMEYVEDVTSTIQRVNCPVPAMKATTFANAVQSKYLTVRYKKPCISF